MKKFVSLFLIAVLCIAMLPLQAFAAEDPVHSEECSHVEHSKGCSHSNGYYYQTQVTYGEYDGTYHYRIVIRNKYCSKCHQLLSATVTSASLEKHTFDYPNWHYISSSHVGHYSTHYYTYGRACLICNASYTKPENAGCRPNNCIDPQ